jgi:hypothetical protein
MRTLTAAVAVLVTASAAAAQSAQNPAYRYVDDRGVIHWAQSIHLVPPAYASRAITPDFRDTSIFPTPPPYMRPATAHALSLTLQHRPRLPSLHDRYAAELRRIVGAAWTGRGQDGPQPVIAFDILRDGRLSIPDVERSSGDFAYDLRARDTIIALRRLPPLPKDFPGTRLRVQVGFALMR